MEQLTEQEPIDARVVAISSRGRNIKVWEVNFEESAPKSCLICTHYKFAEHNYQAKAGRWVHICMLHSPEWADLSGTIQLSGVNLKQNYACKDFQRRAV
jgi:hypothetical protein